MLKQFFFFALLLFFGATKAAAQPGNPCDPASVAQVQAELIAEGFDCLQNAGPFQCVYDVFHYAFDHCPPPIDTTGNNPCTPEAVLQVQADLLAQGFTCLEAAGPFTCVDEVINFALTYCPIDGSGGSPCDPEVVAQLQADLVELGYTCLANAGPFQCVDDVYDYASINCPVNVDTSWHTLCDPIVVAQAQSDLIAQGYDCLANAGPFQCVGDVVDFALANCPLPIDTTWDNPCDSAIVAQTQYELFLQGYTCLENAGPFQCVYDVIDYALANCPVIGDTTCNNPCYPAAGAQPEPDLIAQGYDCLIGAGPFQCVDEVFNFVFINCAPPIDTTGGDPCTPAAVQQTIQDLLAQGYDCVANAGPFQCVHEVVCYAMNNCPQDIDTVVYDIPECVLNVPADIVTFQQFLQYIIANCDSTFIATIPACWLAAPAFSTDEEFLAWITENCELDSLVSGNAGMMANRFFSSQGSVSTREPNTQLDMLVSPNPTTSILNIALKESAISRIELFDVDGRRRMMQESNSGNQTTIQLGQLPAGMYMLRVQDDKNGVATRRIVKE